MTLIDPHSSADAPPAPCSLEAPDPSPIAVAASSAPEDFAQVCIATEWLLAACLCLAFVLLPDLALAQTSNADAGSTLWSAFRTVLYGPWGLVGSAIVVAIGIYMFLERGFMHALGVMAAGALIFFVPLIVVSMRNTAQALGGAG